MKKKLGRIKPKKKYVASDGREFDSAADAEDYQAFLDRKAATAKGEE